MTLCKTCAFNFLLGFQPHYLTALSRRLLTCISICFQAMYSEFSTLNIQIDKDFTAKLSGYGCVGFNTEEISNAPAVCSCMTEYNLKFEVVR